MFTIIKGAIVYSYCISIAKQSNLFKEEMTES